MGDDVMYTIILYGVSNYTRNMLYFVIKSDKAVLSIRAALITDNYK